MNNTLQVNVLEKLNGNGYVRGLMVPVVDTSVKPYRQEDLKKNPSL